MRSILVVLLSLWYLVMIFPVFVNNKKILIHNLSSQLIDYKTSLNWQQNLQNQLINSNDCTWNHHLIILQHNSVYTLGSSSETSSGPFRKELSNGKILSYDIVNVERGGQTTYHGPGQIVVYPIINLNNYEKDIHKYLRLLEKVIIDSLDNFNIKGYLIPGLTGVWVNDKKIAAIGIKISRWITMHGFSVNLYPDLDYFNNIIPCGLSKGVCSVHDYNSKISIDEFTNVIIENICKSLNISDYHIFNDRESIQFLNCLENS